MRRTLGLKPSIKKVKQPPPYIVIPKTKRHWPSKAIKGAPDETMMNAGTAAMIVGIMPVTIMDLRPTRYDIEPKTGNKNVASNRAMALSRSEAFRARSLVACRQG